jgi:hypothetical protein
MKAFPGKLDGDQHRKFAGGLLPGAQQHLLCVVSACSRWRRRMELWLACVSDGRSP